VTGFWTPPTAKLVTVAELPVTTKLIRLGDGRNLKYLGPWVLRPTGVEAQAWTSKDGMRVLISLDPGPHGTLLHLSVSRARTLPSWKDIILLKAAFFGEKRDAMMIVPTEISKEREYMLEIHETPQRWTT
jgi:hypothetical protein